MELHPQSDWQRAQGQYVEIRRLGKTIRVGIVEAVMPDNSVLWISAAGVYSRTMFEKAEGHEVYARYSWDAPPAMNQIPSPTDSLGQPH